MKMPINYTTASPSLQLIAELDRLCIIAALSHNCEQWQLKEQAIQIHDKLVDSYNSQIPENKPKGFWRQFLDNITFRDLDTTITMRLEKLRDSEELEKTINRFSGFSQEESIENLYKIINREDL